MKKSQVIPAHMVNHITEEDLREPEAFLRGSEHACHFFFQRKILSLLYGVLVGLFFVLKGKITSISQAVPHMKILEQIEIEANVQTHEKPMYPLLSPRNYLIYPFAHTLDIT